MSIPEVDPLGTSVLCLADNPPLLDIFCFVAWRLLCMLGIAHLIVWRLMNVNLMHVTQATLPIISAGLTFSCSSNGSRVSIKKICSVVQYLEFKLIRQQLNSQQLSASYMQEQTTTFTSMIWEQERNCQRRLSMFAKVLNKRKLFS